MNETLVLEINHGRADLRRHVKKRHRRQVVLVGVPKVIQKISVRHEF